jgi:hypothetical protein
MLFLKVLHHFALVVATMVFDAVVLLDEIEWHDVNKAKSPL